LPPVIAISDAGRHVGEEVSIRGWLYNKRESGKLLFPLIRDGSGIMQGVVVKKEVSPEVFSRVKSLTQESTLQVTGSIRQEPRAPGGHEMSITGVEIYQLLPEDDPYPITPKDHGINLERSRSVPAWARACRVID